MVRAGWVFMDTDAAGAGGKAGGEDGDGGAGAGEEEGGIAGVEHLA